MSWNYRVILRDGEFAIYEVFYKEDGSIEGTTVDPVYPRAESLEGLREELERYSTALDKPVLPYLP